MTYLNFYKFTLAQLSGTKTLFKPGQMDESSQPYSDEYECLASFFDVPTNKFPLVVTKVTNTGDRPAEETDTHACEVMRIQEGVILFTIEDNRVKHTTVDKQDIENPHHPYTHIILDTRPGCHVMAIERNSAFGSSNQRLLDILKEGIDRLIGLYHYEIFFTELKKSRSDFWETVNDLRVQFEDAVKQIRIDFQGNDRDTNSNEMLRMMTAIAKKANSEGSFLLSGSKDGEVNINEIRDDLEGIADICLSHPSYCLAVRFKNFGLYRYGAAVGAQFELDDNTLKEFANGHLVMDFDTSKSGFALITWLDKIYVLLDGYEETTVIHTGRKNRNRR